MRNNRLDWRIHCSRLHAQPSNKRFQSVYTKREEPVFQDMGRDEGLPTGLVWGSLAGALLLLALFGCGVGEPEEEMVPSAGSQICYGNVNDCPKEGQ